MPDFPPLRRPSDQINELRDQLLRELQQFDKEGGSKEPELFRAYLQHAQVLAWRGVADGRMEAPREILEALRAAESFVYLHLATQPDPAAAAAQEVHFTLGALYLAGEALEKRRVEDRLADERSQTEREILRVLFENRGKYLRRGTIHEKLNLPNKPTPARVGQILVELDSEGLLLHIHGRAQGNPNAAFYALSGRGIEVCRSLGLGEEVPTMADIEQILKFVGFALDLASSEEDWKLVVNMLANRAIGPLGTQVLEALERVVQELGTPKALRLYREVFEQVQLTRRLAATGGKGWTVEQSDVKNPGTLVFDPISQQEKEALQAARKKERMLEMAEV